MKRPLLILAALFALAACLLLPFGTLLAKAATAILPDKAAEEGRVRPLEKLLHEYRSSRLNLGNAAIHTDALRHEVERMLSLAAENIQQCYQAILKTDTATLAKAEETEEQIDLINKDVSEYVSHILITAGNSMDVQAIENYFTISSNAERIGDHAINIGGYVEVLKRKGIVFSDIARNEIVEMQQIATAAMAKVLQPAFDSGEWLQEVSDLEEQIDDITDRYREFHLERMRQGKCTAEACVLYSEMLTDFERIGDHVLNIAEAYSKMRA
jgi:phosphate:Na+ symporter